MFKIFVIMLQVAEVFHNFHTFHNFLDKHLATTEKRFQGDYFTDFTTKKMIINYLLENEYNRQSHAASFIFKPLFFFHCTGNAVP